MRPWKMCKQDRKATNKRASWLEAQWPKGQETWKCWTMWVQMDSWYIPTAVFVQIIWFCLHDRRVPHNSLGNLSVCIPLTPPTFPIDHQICEFWILNVPHVWMPAKNERSDNQVLLQTVLPPVVTDNPYPFTLEYFIFFAAQLLGIKEDLRC